MEVYDPTPRGELLARLCLYLAGLAGASAHRSPRYMGRVLSRDLVRFSPINSVKENPASTPPTLISLENPALRACICFIPLLLFNMP